MFREAIVEVAMKWFVVLFVLAALLCSVLAEERGAEESGVVDVRNADYTSNYAELAAPVPANVNEQDIVASLLRSAAPA